MSVDGSFWILKVQERLADEVTAFDQVKDRIQEEMSRDRFEKVYGEYIADLKKNAVYTVFVREAPTTLGRQRKPAPRAISEDDEIITSGSARPERVAVPSAQPTPTPDVR